jgi:RNA polymerase sigma-70 factor (ECF subfamily)
MVLASVGSRARIVAPESRTDEDNLLRAKAGDGQAFVSVFDQYYSRVERYARWLVKDADLAADIASETFIRAYRSLSSYKPGQGSYLAYLLQICRRQAYDACERLRNRASVSLDDVDEALAAQAITTGWRLEPMQSLLESERREAIRVALDRLDDGDREIIALAFEDDLSRKEIMEILGKPSISAVTSHLHRAMCKVRVELARSGYTGNATGSGRL